MWKSSENIGAHGLLAHCLRLLSSNAGAAGLIPGQGTRGLPCWLSDEDSACQAGDAGLIPESGRSHGVGNCNPLHYSCLENSMDRGAWWSVVHGVANSGT